MRYALQQQRHLKPTSKYLAAAAAAVVGVCCIMSDGADGTRLLLQPLPLLQMPRGNGHAAHCCCFYIAPQSVHCHCSYHLVYAVAQPCPACQENSEYHLYMLLLLLQLAVQSFPMLHVSCATPAAAAAATPVELFEPFCAAALNPVTLALT
jgi:endogenous inhibitor of DNA gyrase (YacG/DUF329 family)